MPTSADFLSYLAGVAVRSLCLAAAAALALALFRVRAAAFRHAVWTVVAAGMLLLAGLSLLLPPLELPLLAVRPAAPPIVFQPVPSGGPSGPASVSQPAPVIAIGWPTVLAGIYALGVLAFLGRLAFSYLFTHRLVRASCPAGDILESSWISVPMTVGWLRPKILLPAGWREWDALKLEAVLVHERTHVRRADWAISVLAALNRAVFWFNPLAWWLERRLGTLAEQACDDAALLQIGKPEPYAQALLDMAAAVKTGQGRLVWEAMAMAKAAEVRKRIERILDETRQIPRGLTRLRWAALLACSLPLICLTSVLQLVPARAQINYSDLRGKTPIAAGDVAAMEQRLAANPHDIDTRGQLIVHYFSNGQKQQRLNHIFWLIANHPEAPAAAVTSAGILPRTTSFNDASDHTRAAAMWKQQAAAKPKEAAVLINAARFFWQAAADFEEAERLYLAARAADSSGNIFNALVNFYVATILGGNGDSRYPRPSAAFLAKVQSHLESSTDMMLLFAAGRTLSTAAVRPQPGQRLPVGIVNLDQHPELAPAVEFGNRLLARAAELGGPPVQVPTSWTREGGAQPAQPRTAQPAAQSTSQPLALTPPLVNRVDPEYPPLARQARIQGIARLRVLIAQDGSVKEMTVVSGHPLLIPAALEAVRRWRFQASGQEVLTLIDLPFTLPPAETQPAAPAAQGGAQSGVPGAIIGSTTPAMIRVGGNVQAARMRNKVDPVYPPEARDAGIKGEVSLEIGIGEDGVVESLKFVEGHPALAAAAITAVRQWVYLPTLLNGTPVKVTTTVKLSFPPE